MIVSIDGDRHSIRHCAILGEVMMDWSTQSVYAQAVFE